MVISTVGLVATAVEATVVVVDYTAEAVRQHLV
jgi:hypothetical protein